MRYREADVLERLGDTRDASGNRPGALHAWQQALRILQDLHRPGADLLLAKLGSDNGEPVGP